VPFPFRGDKEGSSGEGYRLDDAVSSPPLFNGLKWGYNGGAVTKGAGAVGSYRKGVAPLAIMPVICVNLTFCSSLYFHHLLLSQQAPEA